jgi:oligosaccharyltransferase complex subunit alpha (ribophorin I)
MDVLHTGAKLVGSFSRFEYMRRQGGASSVKAFKMLLPPGSSGVYYRDEIGNISTSNLRVPPKAKKNDPVELELRPRFPLFGGWKTRYTIGYNLPVYQYLFNKGSTNHKNITHIKTKLNNNSIPIIFRTYDDLKTFKGRNSKHFYRAE